MKDILYHKGFHEMIESVFGFLDIHLIPDDVKIQ